jgi:hypothetical protein
MRHVRTGARPVRGRVLFFATALLLGLAAALTSLPGAAKTHTQAGCHRSTDTPPWTRVCDWPAFRLPSAAAGCHYSMTAHTLACMTRAKPGTLFLASDQRTWTSHGAFLLARRWPTLDRKTLWLQGLLRCWLLATPGRAPSISCVNYRSGLFVSATGGWTW